MPPTTESLNIAIAIFVPGFIIYSVRVATQPIHNIEGQRLIFTVLTYGAINFSLWHYFVVFIQSKFELNLYSPDIAGIYYLISPILTTITILLALKILKRLPKIRNIFLKGSADSAWDFAFSTRKNRMSMVNITLKSGETVIGLYAGRSYASSGESERDLYLQYEYKIGEKDELYWVPSIDGVYISHDAIEKIVFYPAKKKET